MRAAHGARRLAAALTGIMALGPGALHAATLTATPSRVVVARPWNADPVTAEALARVSGELVAAGFDVQVIPVALGADPRGTVETVGRELEPAAAFAIFPGLPAPDGTPTAEIWVSDRIAGRATVERLSVDPRSTDRGAAVLAVRAVELLKASVAELWVPERVQPEIRVANARPPAPPPTVAAVAAPPAARAGLAVEAAMAFIDHLGGFAADFCPALRISMGIRPGWTARVGALGFGRGLELSTKDGTATIHQQMGTVDLLSSFRAGHRLAPFVALSAGAFHLDIAGSGNAPWTGRSTGTWDVVGGGGGGVTLALGERAALTAELRALFFWHRPQVLVGGSSGGQGGLPALVATIGVLLQ